jgi:NTE family protein
MADSALVLGPGGPVGTAWLAGLAVGLRREGVDLGAAGLIVGTSAGAIVGPSWPAAEISAGLPRCPRRPIPVAACGLTRTGSPKCSRRSATPGLSGPRPCAGLVGWL